MAPAPARAMISRTCADVIQSCPPLERTSTPGGGKMRDPGNEVVLKPEVTTMVFARVGHKGRDTRCDKSRRHVGATGCCNKSPRVTCENHCRCDRILSLRSVARIQTGLNSCNISQRQNKRKQPCRSVCTLLRQVAATKFESANEGASIIFPPC